MRRSPAVVAILVVTTLSLFGCSLVGTPSRSTPGPQRTARPGGGGATAVQPSPRGRPLAGRTGMGATPFASRRAFSEVRAVWVVRTTLTHPDSVRVMVRRVDEAGFNTIIVQVRGRGDAFYESRWEPAATSLARRSDSFDPLALAISEAHARGIEVHAWVNAHLIGNMGSLPDDPIHVIRARPDLLAVPRELARDLFTMDPADPGYVASLQRYSRAHQDAVEGLYSSPVHPEIQEHVYSVWMDIAERYEVDGIHFDYIRYPNPEYDYSKVALERFRTWVVPRLSSARASELDRAYSRDPLAYVDALPGPWGQFRRAQITELVERIYYGVKKRRPEVTVSAAVSVNADDAYRSRFQDWRGWLRDGIVDVVAPMAYTPDNELFRDLIRTAVEAGGSDRVWAGIGIYRTTYQGTLEKIDILRELGARGMVLFSYDWAVSSGESAGGVPFLARVGRAAF